MVFLCANEYLLTKTAMQFAPWFFHTHSEHAKWQGKINSRSGNDPKYPDFKKSTGYGTGAGLCGWNCRHTFGPYIEGSPPVWSEEQLAELNAPKYEYGGKMLTEYTDDIVEQVSRRVYRSKISGLDVMIVMKGNLLKILRYKK